MSTKRDLDGSTPPDGLCWDAFRYAGGELSETEAAEFEGRLAVDQAAREALAHAVTLTQAVALACEQATKVAPPEPADPSRRSRHRVWACSILACGLAVAALGVLLSGLTGDVEMADDRPSDRPAPPELIADKDEAAGPVSEGVDQLIKLWSDAAMFHDGPHRLSDSARDADAFAEEGSDALSASDLETELVVPTWMFAAVSAEELNEEMPPELRQPEEN